MSDINGIWEAGRLSPVKAAEFRGRLGYAQSLMFGEFGRALLQPVTNRKYYRAIKGERALNKELGEVPRWRAAVFRHSSGRRTWLRWPRPVVIYMDATGCGHLGLVVDVDDHRHVFSPHIPE